MRRARRRGVRPGRSWWRCADAARDAVAGILSPSAWRDGMKRGFLFAIALAGMSALPAMAQDVGDGVAGAQANPIDQEYDRCVEAAGSIDSEMAACSYQAAESWDAAMNTTYRKL